MATNSPKSRFLFSVRLRKFDVYTCCCGCDLACIVPYAADPSQGFYVSGHEPRRLTGTEACCQPYNFTADEELETDCPSVDFDIPSEEEWWQQLVDQDASQDTTNAFDDDPWGNETTPVMHVPWRTKDVP